MKIREWFLNKLKENYIYVLFFLIILIVILTTGYKPDSDDFKFLKLIENDTVFNILTERYCNWTGRIIIEFFMFNLIDNIILISIINSFLSTCIIYSIVEIIFIEENENKEKKKAMLFVIGIYLMLRINVIVSSTIWITGSFNYLWPVSFMLLILKVYKKIIENIEISKISKLMLVIATIIACSVEQTAAVIIVLATILFIFLAYKKKLPIYFIIHYILSLTSFSVLMFAPGNNIRLAIEAEKYYPQFMDITILEKLLQSSGYLLNHILNDNKLIFLLISVLIFIIGKNNFTKIYKVLNIFLITYFSLNCININLITDKLTGYDYNLLLNNFVYKGMLNNYYPNTEYITSILISIIILCIITILLYKVIINKKNKLEILLLYFASICTYLIMSFSPTIMASGHRIFFAGDILIIIIVSYMIREVIKKPENNKITNILLSCIIIIGSLLLIRYFDSSYINNNFY